MNYGQIKAMSLRLLDEYNTTGTVFTTQDVLGRIQGFVNDALFDLAITTAKIPDKYIIAHNPLYNELMRDTSSIKKHLPGVDFPVTLAGAKAYWLEANGPAVVTVDELIDSTWTNLETITIPSNVKVLTEYKNLITASDATNTIRINFSGDYAYDFVNYVLYGCTFPDADSIQQNRNYFQYSLPTDFLMLNYIENRDNAYSDYRIRADNILEIDRDDIGEYSVHYWREPQLLTFTGNATVDDAQIIDTGIPPEGIQIIPYFIAGNSLLSEGSMSKGITLLNLYEQKKSNIQEKEVHIGSGFINVTEW